MENQVTLDRQEYDDLQNFKRKYLHQKEVLDNNEPLILRIDAGYHNEETLRVFSGEREVKELFENYTESIGRYNKDLKVLKDEYEDGEAKLKEIRKILK